MPNNMATLQRVECPRVSWHRAYLIPHGGVLQCELELVHCVDCLSPGRSDGRKGKWFLDNLPVVRCPRSQGGCLEMLGATPKFLELATA